MHLHRMEQREEQQSRYQLSEELQREPHRPLVSSSTSLVPLSTLAAVPQSSHAQRRELEINSNNNNYCVSNVPHNAQPPSAAPNISLLVHALRARSAPHANNYLPFSVHTRSEPPFSFTNAQQLRYTTSTWNNANNTNTMNSYNNNNSSNSAINLNTHNTYKHSTTNVISDFLLFADAFERNLSVLTLHHALLDVIVDEHAKRNDIIHLEFEESCLLCKARQLFSSSEPSHLSYCQGEEEHHLLITKQSAKEPSSFQ